MHNRRRFITLLPFAGAGLLAACSKQATEPAATPAPAPAAPAREAAASMPAPSTVASAPAAAPAAIGSTSLPVLDPGDAAALALGYVAQASQADAAKYKNFAAGQACSNCSLFGGKAGDSQGPCPLFAGKQVLATGWCSAYVKKTG